MSLLRPSSNDRHRGSPLAPAFLTVASRSTNAPGVIAHIDLSQRAGTIMPARYRAFLPRRGTLGARASFFWGVGEILRRAQNESIRLSSAMKRMFQIHYEFGPMKVAAAFARLENGLVSPNVDVIGRPSEVDR